MSLNPSLILRDLWLFIAAVWLLGAIRNKPIARRQPLAGQLLHRGLVVAGWFLLFSRLFVAGPLGWRFVKQSPVVSWIGVAVTAAGIAFMLWARLVLAGNWSGNVTVKESHTLVVRGPYRLVRHPIYAGITLASAGTALAVGEVHAAVGVVLVLAGWRLKWPVEERFMLEEFGSRYAEYRERVSALIPGIW